MTVKDTLIDMLVRYPSIFENKWKCYKHLFSAYGNGYDWHDGELVEFIYAKRGKDEYGYPRKIVPTLAKLGIKKRDIPDRVYKEMEDFTPVFTITFDRLPELRKKAAERFYDDVLSTMPEDLRKTFLKGKTREQYIKYQEKYGKPIVENMLSEGETERDFLLKTQCKEYSYVYNYPENMKSDWAAARQEWEDYLKSMDAYIN